MSHLVSSGRQAIACILLIFGVAIYSQAQTTPTKQSTASVSGKVTLKGKGVPGIVVMATDYHYRGMGNRTSYRATTDESGKYRITNVPEGTYQISPQAPAFALENENANNAVNVAEGETIEDLNFVLVRGGVITGRVTDSDGQPLIEQQITLTVQHNHNMVVRSNGQFLTDDRGVYRAFGLRAGKYRVAAGSDGHRLPGPGRPAQYGLTFYPSTTDENKATEIEVSEGSEIKDIDIVMSSHDTAGFKVTGKIIDGQTGKPLANIIYGVTQHHDGGASSTSGARSNAEGEFKFDSLLPGKYSVFIQPQSNTEIRANPVRFDVTDSDVSGLVVKAVKGATMSGLVVIEGVDEKSIAKKLAGIHVAVQVSSPNPNADENEADYMNQGSSMLIKPDGTFRVSGLRGGTAQIYVHSMGSSNSQDMVLVRVERDGVVQPNAINIKDGEHVQGVRLFIKQLTGAIRGQVKIEGGELPRSTQMYVSVSLIEDPSQRSYRSEQIDSRGRFYFEGLAAGRHEIRLNAFGPGVPQDTRQEVTVTDNSVTEVVLTVKLKNAP